jgi:hypothetical protein
MIQARMPPEKKVHKHFRSDSERQRELRAGKRSPIARDHFVFGKATADAGGGYVKSLTGSTIEVGKELKFTLSGTMTRGSGPADDEAAAAIGYSPSISLAGTVDYSAQLVSGLKNVMGLLTPSAERPSTPKVVYNIGGPLQGWVR